MNQDQRKQLESSVVQLYKRARQKYGALKALTAYMGKHVAHQISLKHDAAAQKRIDERIRTGFAVELSSDDHLERADARLRGLVREGDAELEIPFAKEKTDA